MSLPKRLQMIDEYEGLQATYGGGDYVAYVYADVDGDYEIEYHKTGEIMPAFQRDHVKANELENAMRSIQGDLRKWRKVVYGEL